MGVGLIIYLITVVVFAASVFSGVMTCNEFITVGPTVKESFLCKPMIFFVVMPVMIISELLEDISSGMLTHADLYTGLLGIAIIYFGTFAFLGIMYGKRKRSD